MVKRPLAGIPAEDWVRTSAGAYLELAQRHLAGVEWVAD